jgi:catechol 2,3-dioxygenase-like lactoylglutathione lyase family enzyme
VHDYDEALRFYRDAVGLSVLDDDVTLDGQRLLHVEGPAPGGGPVSVMAAETGAGGRRSRVGRPGDNRWSSSTPTTAPRAMRR